MRVCKSHPAVLGAGFLLGVVSLSTSAAMIVPTGGSVTISPSISSPTTAIDADYGDLHASGSIIVHEMGQASEAGTGYLLGNVAPNSITLQAYGLSPYDFDLGGQYDSRLSGSLGFDLTDAATLSFSFQQLRGQFVNVFADSQVTIRDAQGSIVFGCVGDSSFDGTYGGCATGAMPTSASDDSLLPNDGFIALLAGHYDISFATAGRSYTGVGTTGNIDLNLSVVPLPATLPLLLSGLGLIGARRRRAQRLS